MPTFFIRTVNSHFETLNEGEDYDQPEDALAAGIRGAVAIGADELVTGERSAAVEICIEGVDGKALLRSVVAVSVSSLWTGGM